MDFIHAGGTIIPTLSAKDHIQQAIKNKSPIIASITSKALSQRTFANNTQIPK